MRPRRDTAAHRAQQLHDAIAASRRFGLRLLSGTDRQVAWAYQLRLTALHRALAHATGYGGWDTTRDSAIIAELVAAANTRTSAGQWIKLRHYGAEALLADCGYMEELSTLPLAAPEEYAPAPF